MYVMYYSFMVIISLNSDLFESAFPTYSFTNLAFPVSLFCIFCLFFYELNVVFKELKHLSN